MTGEPPGPRLLLEPDRSLPLFQVLLRVGSGSALDPAGKEGLAELTTRLLRQGAAGRPAAEIERALDRMGGSVVEELDHDAIDLSAEFLAEDFERGLALFFDLALRPDFPRGAVARERRRQIEDIAALRDDPAALADLYFDRALYAPHPYHRSELGTRESVRTLRRDDVIAFHREHFRPDNLIVGVSGDFDPGRARRAIEERLGPIAARARPATVEVPRPNPLPRGRKVLLVHRRGLEQTQLRIGGMGIRGGDPDLDRVELANTAFGGGYASRLVDEIRIRGGLGYDIESSFDTGRTAGSFVIESATKHDAVLPLVERCLESLRIFRNAGPTDEEAERAVRYRLGMFAFEVETADSRMEERVDAVFYGQPESYLDSYADRIRSVTPAELRRVAREHFPADALLIVAVTDARRTHRALRELGEVETVSARTGRPVKPV